jgi:hypothetical protein
MLYVLLPVFVLVTPFALAQDSCEQANYGKCFSIHARFAVYTGDGMEELWPVGSRRLLWVVSGNNNYELNRLLGDRPDDFYIFGDFIVCPLNKEVPGQMRHVCIKEMRNLKLVKRHEKIDHR